MTTVAFMIIWWLFLFKKIKKIKFSENIIFWKTVLNLVPIIRVGRPYNGAEERQKIIQKAEEKGDGKCFLVIPLCGHHSSFIFYKTKIK